MYKHILKQAFLSIYLVCAVAVATVALSVIGPLSLTTAPAGSLAAGSWLVWANFKLVAMFVLPSFALGMALSWILGASLGGMIDRLLTTQRNPLITITDDDLRRAQTLNNPIGTRGTAPDRTRPL